MRAEYVYRRFDRMCCLHIQGASGINWGIEKCQVFRTIARIVHSKCSTNFQHSTGRVGPKGQ